MRALLSPPGGFRCFFRTGQMYASSLISTSRSIFRQRPCLINRLCAHSSAGVPQRLGSESELRNPRGLAKGRGVRGTRQRALGGEEKKSGSAVVVDPMPSLVSAEWLQSRCVLLFYVHVYIHIRKFVCFFLFWGVVFSRWCCRVLFWWG